MRPLVGGRTGAIRALPGLMLVVGLLAAPEFAQAAAPTFGTPEASAEWGSGVTFAQPVTLPSAATRAELLLSSPLDDAGFFVADTGTAPQGRSTLRYELGSDAGSLIPNTTYLGRWRLTFPDGSTALGPTVRTTYRDTRFDWRTITGSTVRIHWYEGDAAFGRRALAIAERAIASSATLLGVTETRMVDFFVYADEEAFYDALGPGTRENVGGQAIPELRTLFALITPESIGASWVETVIPHELSHLVFDTAVRNPYHYPPSWLNEGLAVYLAQGYDRSDRGLVRDAVRDGSLMPLEALTGQFPTTYDMFALAYAESVSAVDFAVRTFGKPALVELIRSYARGVSDDEALTAAFGTDLAGFQGRWLADLGAAPPTRHGPVPAVVGSVPDDWSGPAPTAGSGSTGASASTGTNDGAAGGLAGAGGEDGGPAIDPTLEGLGIGGLVAIALALIAVVVLRGRRRGTLSDDPGAADDAGGSVGSGGSGGAGATGGPG